ncbi:hypothetical protein JL720_13588 [Aureococcus anophagefferens]|nr:hypothetical protein JL720_13588 [Aureococcus anophagefferens]
MDSSTQQLGAPWVRARSTRVDSSGVLATDVATAKTKAVFANEQNRPPIDISDEGAVDAALIESLLFLVAQRLPGDEALIPSSVVAKSSPGGASALLSTAQYAKFIDVLKEFDVHVKSAFLSGGPGFGSSSDKRISSGQAIARMTRVRPKNYFDLAISPGVADSRAGGLPAASNPLSLRFGSRIRQPVSARPQRQDRAVVAARQQEALCRAVGA